MSECIISVIIPVYNSSKQLYKTVLSIVNQNVEEMEILLIDDGSTSEKSIRIYEDLDQKYSQVQVIQKKNEGIVRTRIFGIEKAKGTFTVFSDHDDLYEDGAFKKMLEIYEQNQSDIVVGNNAYFILPWLPVKKLKTPNKLIVDDSSEDREAFLQQHYLNFFGWNQFPVATWGKLYKTSLLKSVAFTILDYSFMDDIVLNAQIFFHARKVSFTKQVFYTHFYGGLSSKTDLHKVLAGYTEMFLLRSDLLEKSGNPHQKKFLFYELKNILLHTVDKFFEEGNYQKEELFNILGVFRKSRAFQELADFYGDSNEGINCLRQNDMEGLLQFGKKRYKKNKYKLTVKKVIKKFY